MKRYLILLGLAGILYLLFIALPHLPYGWMQLRGQLNVIYGSKPIAEILDQPNISDSLKSKLEMVREIKQFAYRELGLEDHGNYSDFYDHGQDPILWVVTACPEFSLEPYEWSFPIVGKFPYKGFFDHEKGIKEMDKLIEEGYEADIGPVQGWSTLGIFNDPVLSSWLDLSEGELANLLIHEITHGTIFIKDSVEFNENLASFIGDMGAREYLMGEKNDSLEFWNYDSLQSLRMAYRKFMVEMAPILDTTYLSMAEMENIQIKRAKKQAVLDSIKGLWISRFPEFSDSRLIASWELKNTDFAGFLRYNSYRDDLDREFKELHSSSVLKMIKFYKERQ